MSVQSDLYKIKDIKKDIFNEIKNKKVEIQEDTPFESYANKVSEITGGGSDNTILKTISTIPNPNVGMCVFSTPAAVLAEESALFRSSDDYSSI